MANSLVWFWQPDEQRLIEGVLRGAAYFEEKRGVRPSWALVNPQVFSRYVNDMNLVNWSYAALAGQVVIAGVTVRPQEGLAETSMFLSTTEPRGKEDHAAAETANDARPGDPPPNR